MALPRTGSSSLASSFFNSSFVVKQEGAIPGEEFFPADTIRDSDVDLFKIVTWPYEEEELYRISKENRVCFLWRENIYEAVISLCLMKITNITQRQFLTDIGIKSYRGRKFVIPKEMFFDFCYEYFRWTSQIKKIAKENPHHLSLTYEQIYYYGDKREILQEVADYFECNLDLDMAVDSISPDRGKLNDYNNIANMGEVDEWIKEYAKNRK